MAKKNDTPSMIEVTPTPPEAFASTEGTAPAADTSVATVDFVVDAVDATIEKGAVIVTHVLESEGQALATLIDNALQRSPLSQDAVDIVRAFRERLGV